MSQTILTTAVIILFVAVIALGVLVFSLARQIGVLYERIAPAGALAVNKSVKAGEQAPAISVKTIDEEVLSIGAAGNRATLMFFLSPDCPICKQILKPLKSAAKAESGWLDVILASDGDNLGEHRAFIERESLEAYPYVLSEALGKTYGVSKLPYGVLIDEQQQIVALGIINSREHLESLFEAKERGFSDIQSYLSSKSTSDPKMA
ncbi:redoxin domain-containing protein [Suttonella sp. R2A3]|uniref:redoxin family protein n=1 Tax=Suttonella sp. R2A3 TaxID=2908648 RepID=UPI001F38A3FF|nr:redoxin family protein [Suttonella sp. R2A3]UJF24225.1 redoxin domain-containing protein [Suttonella sp. R2A3]